ncbi:UNVERIFIED_CONTAM: hypothetical protein FKN15_015387 [Acipenser sinensis]
MSLSSGAPDVNSISNLIRWEGQGGAGSEAYQGQQPEHSKADSVIDGLTKECEEKMLHKAGQNLQVVIEFVSESPLGLITQDG